MAVKFGNVFAADPSSVAEALADDDLPIGDWFGVANSFRCPLGYEPGSGLLILRRSSLDELRDGSGAIPLTDLAFSTPRVAVVIHDLTVIRSTCLTPGKTDDPAAWYAVHVADKRRSLADIPIDKAYNLRLKSGRGFRQSTLQTSTTSGSGSSSSSGEREPWTWTKMVEDIWNQLPIADSFPGLPFDPDGTPEGFDFYAGYAWRALCIVLDRLGCAVRYDPLGNTFDIVRLGSDVPAGEDPLVQFRPRTWDDAAIEEVRPRIPETVRVRFTKHPSACNVKVTHEIDVDIATVFGELPLYEIDAVATVIDDMTALIDDAGEIENADELQTRAEERAADFYRQMIHSGRRVHRVFEGAHAVMPTAKIYEVAWEDRGGGVRTSVGREAVVTPFALFEEYATRQITPCKEWFWAMITSVPPTEGSSSNSSSETSSDGCPEGYGFQEIEPTGCGEWRVVEGGMKGDGFRNSLYELNDNRVAKGTRVQAWADPAGESFIFTAGGGGARRRIELLTGACLVAGTVASSSGGEGG